MGKLYAKQLDALGEGMHGDGDGLYLQVSETGRSWILRYQLAGRRRMMGLGSLDDVSLAEARRRVRDARQILEEGSDPIDARDAELRAKRLADAQAVTFKDAAEAYIKANRDGWRNDKHAAQWPATLKRYVYPKLGTLPVGAIDTDLVLKVLEPIWRKKPETASRVRGRIETVLAAATARARTRRSGAITWTSSCRLGRRCGACATSPPCPMPRCRRSCSISLAPIVSPSRRWRSLHGLDCGAYLRDDRHDLAGARYRQSAVDRAWGAHEGRAGASRPPQRARAGHRGTHGQGARQPLRVSGVAPWRPAQRHGNA
jgi:hypothetical protein